VATVTITAQRHGGAPHTVACAVHRYVGAAAGSVPAGDSHVSGFASASGRPLAIRHLYFAGAIPATLAASKIAADAGVRKVLADFRPAADGSQVQALAAFLQSCAAGGLNASVTLHHEMYSKFASPAAYFAAIAPYVPVIRAAGYQHVWCATNYSIVHHGALAFYPGDALCDAISPDYYPGDGGFTGSVTNDTLDMVAAFADARGKPFGLCEFSGYAAAAAPSTEAQGDAFLARILAFFEARLAAGKPVHDLVCYATNDNGGSYAAPWPASFTTGYQRIYDAFAT
jgi:hypothetical protein